MAKLLVNPDRSELEVEFPDGNTSEVLEWPADNYVLFAPEETEPPFLLALEGNGVGLAPDTLYKLIAIPTTVEETDFEDDPDGAGDDDEPEGADDEPAGTDPE